MDREPPVEEYERFKRQARGEYKYLMMEFEFRCQRAGMMYYHEADWYSQTMFRMEIVAASVGTVSLASIGASTLQMQTPSLFRNISKIRGVGAVGVAAAVIIELISKGSIGIIPSLRYTECYHDLITQREKICSTVLISESTYKEYNDPKIVFESLKRRKEELLKFLELQRKYASDVLERRNADGTNDKTDS